MLWPRAAFGEDHRDVHKRLPDLGEKPLREVPLVVPTDNPSCYDDAAVGGNAVGIALRCRPAAGLQGSDAGSLFVLRNRQHGENRRFWRAHRTVSIFVYSAAKSADAGPAFASCRRANRFSLPVSVFGSWVTNSSARGYLYGAISRLTCSCKAVARA